MTKRCAGPCGALKPSHEFYSRASAADGLQSLCKDCSRFARQRWAHENRVRLRALDRRARERRSADPERSAAERDRKREWLRNARGITPDRYRVGVRPPDAEIPTAPILAALEMVGLPTREVAHRLGRDDSGLGKALRKDTISLGLATAILAAVDVAPVDVDL